VVFTKRSNQVISRYDYFKWQDKYLRTIDGSELA